MALSVSLVEVFVIGDRKEVIADVTFDSSYPTDGEALVGSQVSLGTELSYVSSGVAMKSDESDAVVVAYDAAAGKLVAFQSTTGAPNKLVEVANTTDLSAYTARLRFVGKGTASA